MEIVINKRFSSEERDKLHSLLADAVKNWKEDEPYLKSGRGKIKKLRFNNLSLIVRKYYRGGVVQKLTRDFYFRLPLFSNNYRPTREFEILNKLHSANLPVPNPIAYIIQHCSSFRYQGFIVTEEILPSKNMLDSVDSESIENLKIFSKAAGEVAHMILNHNVFHPDLHLGNVLIQNDSKVYIIDFDKAKIFPHRKRKFYALKIIKRWLHSCLRHHINKIAYNPFCEGIDIDNL